jgi:AcrR family transcriptional regulator
MDMGRKALDREVRRQQFIRAAEELFRQKGYDSVTMSEIADKVGVSHGAYFYYYRSKEELMRAVIVHNVRDNERDLKAMVENDEIPALEKMQLLFAMTIEAYAGSDMVEFPYGYGNATVFREYTVMSREANIPLLAEIIRQGNREGSFDVKYPEDTMEYLFFVFENLYDVVRATHGDRKLFDRKMRALETLLGRALGTRKDAFSLTEK